MKNAIMKRAVLATSATTILTGVAATTVISPNFLNLTNNVSAAETTVTNNDNAVIAYDDVAVTQYKQPVTINVLENDELSSENDTWNDVKIKDPEGNFVKSMDTENGSFVVNKDNTITFTPNTFVGILPTLTYQATDSKGRVVTAKVDIVVGNDTNSTAKGINDKIVTKENTRATIDVLKNDVIAENDSVLRWSLLFFDKNDVPSDTFKVKGGTYEITYHNMISFTPDKGFVGEAPAVTYSAITEQGAEYTAEVSATVVKDNSKVKKDVKKSSTKNHIKNNDSSVKGPKVSTDFVSTNNTTDVTGIAGITTLALLGGAAVLRRKRK